MRPTTHASTSANTIAPLFQLDRESGLSLQEQIRQRIIEAIEIGVFPAGHKLPSTRELSDILGLSRNTVVLAYQRLTDDGHLATRDRSGVYVAEGARPLHVAGARIAGREKPATLSHLSQRLRGTDAEAPGYLCPPDWQIYRYPFIEGRYDRSLFPIAEWRESSRLALAAKEVEAWSLDNGEADDEALVEAIRTKLLPRRGIQARPDEILITAGGQQALHLAAELFAGPESTAGVEEPGLIEMRELFTRRGAKLCHLPVDDKGLIIGPALSACDIVHVTPSRQRPTAVTLSLERRQDLLELAAREDFLIIEDDFECELTYLSDALPAMRSLDGGDRVIYTANLSKALAPGVGLGFMVAPPEVINAARHLRNLNTRRPSPNIQRAAAFFLSLGHYDAMLRRLIEISEKRLIALRDALNHYRPLSIAIAPVKGGTTFWVRGPEGMDAKELMRKAEANGVLIESADHYFAADDAPRNMFRLGVTSLPSERIREGIAELSNAMQDLSVKPRPIPSAEVCLTGNEITKAFSGASLLYKTVYGEPCTIELSPDGRMRGRAGFANEDRDNGRWWIEGDRWFRQWHSWAYGEAVGFRVAIDKDQVSWINEEGQRVDGATLLHARN